MDEELAISDFEDLTKCDYDLAQILYDEYLKVDYAFLVPK
jgi:hypothetical protein